MASSARPPSQIVESPWSTFQLTRFSHATNEILNAAHVQWIHIPERENLSLVLDFSPVKVSDNQWEDSKVLKVFRGSDVIESLDLRYLVQVAVVEETRIRELKLPISEARVSTLIRSPCIAIRYVTATSKVRRFQLRFVSDQVFETAIAILRNIGLPLHQSLPSSVTSAGVPPVPPRSSSQSRPSSTAQAPGTSSGDSFLGKNFSVLPYEAIASHGPYRTASLSSLLPSADFFRDSSMSERRTTVDFSMPPPDNRHRSAGTLFSGIQNTPANSQAASLQGFAITPRPATTPASTLQTPDSLSQLLPPRRILPFDLPAVASNPKTATLGADTTTIQASHQAANVCEPIATKKTGTRTRKQQAKPKAKAPKAPKSKKGEGVVKSAVDDLDSQILHSQPERNLATPARVAVPAVQPLAHAAPLTAPSDNGPDEISPNGRKRSLMEVEDSQDTEDRLLSAVRRRSENNEHSRLQQAADNSRLPDANQNPSGLSSGLEQVSSEYLNRINSFVSKNMARPPPQAPLEASPEQDNSLKAYAAQSDEDRLAAIDTMICKNIMDDNFLKLCEDVERSWRRIGLGSSSAAESGVAKHIQQISKSADAALLENMCAD